MSLFCETEKGTWHFFIIFFILYSFFTSSPLPVFALASFRLRGKFFFVVWQDIGGYYIKLSCAKRKIARGAQGIVGARSGHGVRTGAGAIAKPRKARFFCGEATKKMCE
jgi:hypothetical protein